MKFLAVIGLVGVLTGVKCEAEAEADPAILNSFLPSYSHLSQDESGRFVYVVNSAHGGNNGAEGDMGVAETDRTKTVQLPYNHFYPGYYPGLCPFGACRNIPNQFPNGFNNPWSYGLPWGAYPGYPAAGPFRGYPGYPGYYPGFGYNPFIQPQPQQPQSE